MDEAQQRQSGRWVSISPRLRPPSTSRGLAAHSRLSASRGCYCYDHPYHLHPTNALLPPATWASSQQLPASQGKVSLTPRPQSKSSAPAEPLPAAPARPTGQPGCAARAPAPGEGSRSNFAGAPAPRAAGVTLRSERVPAAPPAPGPASAPPRPRAPGPRPARPQPYLAPGLLFGGRRPRAAARTEGGRGPAPGREARRGGGSSGGGRLAARPRQQVGARPPFRGGGSPPPAPRPPARPPARRAPSP